MRRLCWIVLFCCSIGICSDVYATIKKENPQSLFIRGNTLYGLEDYDGAIAKYKQIIDGGNESGNLYYTIGNAYYKKGALGQTLLNYERARRIIPRDSELLSNYRFARSEVKQNFTPKNRSVFSRVLRFYGQKLSVDELATIVVGLFWGILVMVILVFYRVELRMYLLYCIVVLTVLFLLHATCLVINTGEIGKKAIMLAESSDVYFEPFESATRHFLVFEGTQVIVLQRKDGWAKIERADGKIGWVQNTNLDLI